MKALRSIIYGPSAEGPPATAGGSDRYVGGGGGGGSALLSTRGPALELLAFEFAFLFFNCSSCRLRNSATRCAPFLACSTHSCAGKLSGLISSTLFRALTASSYCAILKWAEASSKYLSSFSSGEFLTASLSALTASSYLPSCS